MRKVISLYIDTNKTSLTQVAGNCQPVNSIIRQTLVFIGLFLPVAVVLGGCFRKVGIEAGLQCCIACTICDISASLWLRL